MKNAIQILGAITFFVGFVALVAWGQTEEMCATEAHKTTSEAQACKTHWSPAK